MSFFSNLTQAADIEGVERDTLGGAKVFDSDIYKVTIKQAYGHKSDSGAQALALTLEMENGDEYKETVYVSNKAGQNFYTDKDGKKNYLPGFLMANSLALVAAGKELSALEVEDKVIKLWNKDSKAEVPTGVKMVTEMVGKEVYVTIIRQKVFKQEKNGDGAYVDTDETVERNQIEKFFCANEKFDKLTSTELKAVAGGGERPEVPFYDQWIAKNKGKLFDRTAGKSPKPGTAGGVSKPAGAPGAGKPSSLFG